MAVYCFRWIKCEKKISDTAYAVMTERRHLFDESVSSVLRHVHLILIHQLFHLPKV